MALTSNPTFTSDYSRTLESFSYPKRSTSATKEILKVYQRDRLDALKFTAGAVVSLGILTVFIILITHIAQGAIVASSTKAIAYTGMSVSTIPSAIFLFKSIKSIRQHIINKHLPLSKNSRKKDFEEIVQKEINNQLIN